MCLQRRSYQTKSSTGGRKQGKESIQGQGWSMSKVAGWSDIIKKWSQWKEHNNQETQR